MIREHRQSATAGKIILGYLPSPNWVSVHYGARLTGRCDGCGDQIAMADFTIMVRLQRSMTLQFHGECFDVYGQTRYC